jgi:hypothetical protein
MMRCSERSWLFKMLLVGTAAVLLLMGAERAIPQPFGAADVEADSLSAIVRFLSIDPETGEQRSRFCLRQGEITLIADSLVSRLEMILGVGAERRAFDFTGGDYAPDSLFTNENIYLRREGTGSANGILLVTAHYDAIASLDEAFAGSWQSHPAPGANDNGTGVAALLETARLISMHETPFDIGFILFSAEELGLVGSRAFVEALTEGEVDEILGVLNFDMIGYRALGGAPGVLLMSNLRSGWLADLAIESFEAFDASLATRLYKPAVPYYDHTAFWEASVPAMTFSEPYDEDFRIQYPHYHSGADTMGWIDFDQVERITEAAGNFLLELFESEGECAMLASDIHFNWKGYTTIRRSFSVGDTLIVEFEPRNIGAADPPEGATLMLEIGIESRSGRESVHTSMHVPPPPLKSLHVEIPLVLDETYAGENRLRARISIGGMADDQANNEAVESFAVSGGSQVILDHRFQPNPIGSSFPEASFCVEISRETELKIELLSMEGELIGRAFLGSGSGRPLSVGLNSFRCGELFPAIDRLAAGVYLYRLVLFDPTGESRAFSGRFAVEN